MNNFICNLFISFLKQIIKMTLYKGVEMKVIHDNELGGIGTIPLIVDWRISKVCQIKDCAEKTNAIVCFTSEESPTGEAIHLGICEKHHQEASDTNSFNYTVDL